MKRAVDWLVAGLVLFGAVGVQAQPARRTLTGVRHVERVTQITRDSAASGSADGRTDRLAVSFDAFGRRFALELNPSALFAPTAKTIWVGDATTTETPATEQYYVGRVIDEPGSRVRVRWHAGALDGVVVTPAETYFVAPAAGDGDADDAMVMFRRSDIEVDASHARCGSEDAPVGIASAPAAADSARRPFAFVPATAKSNFQQAQINLVADYEFYQIHGAKAAQVMQDIISQVSAIYEAELGVTLIVGNTVVYTNRNDPFSDTTAPTTLLEEFSDFVGTASSPAHGGDLAHLFTGRDLDGGVVGIAWIGSVCDLTYGSGLSQYLNSSAMVNLVAHEIGHNFAAVHDPLTCTHPPVGYIMQPDLSCVSAGQFSTQSKNDIGDYLTTVSCLDGGGPGLPLASPTATPTPAATRTRTPTPTGPTPTPTLKGQQPKPTETPAFLPQRITGLVLWLDASRIEAHDGDAIATWPDASGLGHNAAQDSSSAQPIYLSAVVNGAAVVHFDGTNDFLSVDAPLVTGKQKRTILIVARPDVVGSRGFVDLGNGSTPGAGLMITPEYAVATGGGQRMWVPGASTAVPAITSIRLNGSSTGNLAAWLNGGRLKVMASKSDRIATAGNMTIGSGTTGSGPRRFAGDIAEILVYNRGLSTKERVQLENYLGQKYGIVVPH